MMEPLWSQIIDAAATVIQAVAVAATAVIAIVSMNAWRRQQIGKRRFSVAEDALTTAYSVQSLMAYVRSGFSTRGEATYGEPTPKGEKRDQLAERRDAFFVPVQRLNEHQEVFSKLGTLEHQCAIYFGPDARAPFAALKEVRATVISSAMTLIQIADQEPTTDSARENREKWEAHLWYGGVKDDELTQMTAKAVQDIEAICIPHLNP